MGSFGLLGDVVHQNKKACIIIGCWVLIEILLLAPPYGSMATMGIGFAIMIVTGAVLLNRYFWIRMFRPLLQLAGAPPIRRGSGECCCCCLCRKQDGSQVRALRAFFVFVYVVIYAITLSAVILEQIVSTTNGRDPHPWMYFSFQWAGGFVLLLVSAWFVDMIIMLIRAVYYCRRRLFQWSGEREGKFALPLWAFPLLWLIAFTTFVSVASVHGEREPIVRRVEVPVANLPNCLDGYSLAMISDIHAGPTVGRDEIARHADAINALGAEAIVMVGDLVDDQVEDIGSIVEPVSRFSAPDGQFFAMGNHEEYTGQAQEWADFVADRGFTVLKDTRVTLPPGADEAEGCYFYLAGVNDFESDPDYGAAMNGRNASIATVLLAHQPTQVSEASKYSVGLILSGHTHGGQIFPYHVLAYVDQGYVSGLHNRDGTFLYVSEGAVGWGPRMRLMSTTEYTHVILRSPELFSDPDTSLTEPTRAAGAAGVLLLMTFVYCLGYPVVKAFHRAKEARDAGNSVDGRDRDLESREVVSVEEVSARRLVAGDNGR